VRVELFEHITITHFGAHKTNAFGFQRIFHAQIGHQRAGDTAAERANDLTMRGQHIEQHVAVDDRAVAVDHDQTVAVAIERNPVIRAVSEHLVAQSFGVSRADVVVDIEAIGRDADRNHIGAKLVENVRGDVVSRAMRAIDHDLHAAQVKIIREGRFAKFDVATGGVFDAADLAQFARGDARLGFVDGGFDGEFNVIVELLAIRAKELDAVVVVRVVRSRNDDAGGQTQRARQVSHTRRRQRASQINIDAGGGEPGHERGFEHIAGNARVLADQHAGAIAMTATRQYAACRITELHRKFRRDRIFADQPPYPVRTKILACHSLT